MDGTTCRLHPYRLGKNPDRPKRVLTPDQVAKMTARLRKETA
jgi:hypothetical protein